MRLFKTNVSVLCVFFFAALYSLTTLAEINPDSSRFFSHTENNINKIHKRLEKAPDTASILLILGEIKTIETQLKSCINAKQKKIDLINQIIKNKAIHEAFSSNSAPSNYLKDKHTQQLNTIANCIYFNYRLHEMYVEGESQIQQTSHSFLLIKTNSLWEQIKAKPWRNVTFSLTELYQQSGLFPLNLTRLIEILASLLVYFGALLFVKWFLTLASSGRLLINPATAQHYFSLLIVIGCFSFPLTLNFTDYTIENILNARLLLIKFSHFAIFARLYIAMLSDSGKWLTPKLVTQLNQRIFILLTVVLLGYIGSHLTQNPHLPDTFFQFRDTIFITLVNISFFWLIWLVFQSNLTKQPSFALWSQGCKISLSTCYAIAILCGLSGYHFLSLMLIPNLIMSLLLIIILKETFQFTRYMYEQITDPSQAISQKFYTAMMLTPGKTLIELKIIELITDLIVLILFFITVFSLWGSSGDQLETYVFHLIYGYKIFGIVLKPHMIIIGASSFCFISLFGKLFSNFLMNNYFSNTEKRAQVTILLMLHYFIFSLALLCGFIIAGVNFTGIALIAGGLSIGIGFGLQKFASDLISGFLILVSEPIKIGDHVIIETTEGYVSNIGILTTQVTTLDEADVLIPNSNIIQQSITNFTYKNNTRYRISIKLSLNDASIFDKAKELILGITAANTDIVQTNPQPIVLFGLNGLELSCVIRDVDKKQRVITALSSAISKTFKANNIAYVTAS